MLARGYTDTRASLGVHCPHLAYRNSQLRPRPSDAFTQRSTALGSIVGRDRRYEWQRWNSVTRASGPALEPGSSDPGQRMETLGSPTCSIRNGEYGVALSIWSVYRRLYLTSVRGRENVILGRVFILLGRCLLALIATTAISAAALNLWIVPLINDRLLPELLVAIKDRTGRKVSAGQVRGTFGLGLWGFTPLVSSSDISIGESQNELSKCSIRTAHIKLHPTTSILQRRLVLSARLTGAEVELMQGANVSWLGVSFAGKGSRTNSAKVAIAERVPVYQPRLGGTDIPTVKERDSKVQKNSTSPGKDTTLSAEGSRSIHSRSGGGILPRAQGSPDELAHPGPVFYSFGLSSGDSADSSRAAPEKDGIDTPASFDAGESAPWRAPHWSRFSERVRRSRGILPSYTPAQLLDDERRAHRNPTVVSRAAATAQRALLHLLASPPVSISHVSTSGARILVFINGDPHARVLENASLVARLSSDLDAVDLKLTSGLQERKDASLARTWLNPGAPRAPRLAPRAPRAPGLSNVPRHSSLRVRVMLSGLRGCDLAALKDPDRTPARLPRLEIDVRPHNFHAPLFERVLDIPADLLDGLATGKLVIRAHDATSWRFPELDGCIEIRNGALHFWDAPDDIIDASARLVFEKGRLYLHNTTAAFGAVPLKVSGDLDLDARGGEIHLSAYASSVGLDSLRATLGLPALPVAVAGAATAQVHVTGPLDGAIISGTASLLRPPGADTRGWFKLWRRDNEDESGRNAPARDVLLHETLAVAALDRIAIESGELEFRLDVRNHELALRAMSLTPLEGGRVRGEGVLRVGREAETDAGAVDIVLRCDSMPVARLISPYLPAGTRLPPDISFGQARAEISLKGSARDVRSAVEFSVPSVSATGKLELAKDAVSVQLDSPTLDVRAKVALDPVRFREGGTTKPALQEPTRPRLTSLSSETTLFQPANIPSVAPPLVGAHVSTIQKPEDPSMVVKERASFSTLDFPMVTKCDVSLRARSLDLLPLLPEADAVREMVHRRLGQPVRLRLNGGAHVVGTVRRPVLTRESASTAASNSLPTLPSDGAGRSDPPTLPTAVFRADSALPLPPEPWSFAGQVDLDGVRLNALRVFEHVSGSLGISPKAARISARSSRGEEALNLSATLQTFGTETIRDDDGDGSIVTGTRLGSARFGLRSGLLAIEGGVDPSGSKINLKVNNLKLDELEFASLRGDLSEASVNVDLEAQSGRGWVSALRPRFSGVRGERMSGGVRWERDVLLLERVQLSQARSRYELSGEYLVPSRWAPPRDVQAVVRAVRTNTNLFRGAGGGRWRIAAHVPDADLQELVPGARLLLAATSPVPADYDRVKTRFLKSVSGARIHVADFDALLSRLIDEAAQGEGGDNASVESGDEWFGAGVESGPSILNAGGYGSTQIPSIVDSATLRSSQDTLRDGPAIFDVLPYFPDPLAAVKSSRATAATQVVGTASSSSPGERQALVDSSEGERGAALGVSPGRGDWPRTVEDRALLSGPGASESLDNVAAASARAKARRLASLLPSLEDLRGQWKGDATIYGSGSIAQRAEFAGRGESWTWGPWTLDALHAQGEYHHVDGLRIEEASVSSGDARGTIRGTVMGPHQDATFRVADLPLHSLAPLLGVARPGELVSRSKSVGSSAPMPTGSPSPPGRRAGLARVLTGAFGRGAERDPIVPAVPSVQGSVYISGAVRGSSDRPTGELAVHLYEAAIGTARMSTARAAARLDDTGRLTFTANAEPVSPTGRSASTGAGEVRADGSFLLHDLRGSSDAVDVRVSARDEGFALLCGIVPGLAWHGGAGTLQGQLKGPLNSPTLMGHVNVSRATVACRYLRAPLRALSASAKVEGGALVLDSFEARSGRTGLVRAHGVVRLGSSWGLAGTDGASSSVGRPPLAGDVLHVVANALEIRVRNAYAGRCDATLQIGGSLDRPDLAGSLALSRGTVIVLPAGVPARDGVNPLGERGATRAPEALSRLMLRNVAVQLGPDLRVACPLVLSVGVEGELTAQGPAHPSSLAIAGEVRLPSGELNLLATQLVLDRTQSNTVCWRGTPGCASDPDVDIQLTTGDLRVAVRGRAHDWKNHLVLRSADSDGDGEGANRERRDEETAGTPRSTHEVGIAAVARAGAHPESAAAAARAFEANLRAALLAEDGRLALGRLAGTAAASLMPKLETTGAVGSTSWRLVSAPSIPGLLRPGTPEAGLLSSITLGAEVEVRFGRRLRVAMARKPRGDDVATRWKLDYRLADTLRVQLDLDSASPHDRTFLLKYNSRGARE